MSDTEQLYKRIIAYLKGLLSNRQRHSLEKEMMHDTFEEESFEGLAQLSANELEDDMNVLMNRLEDRIEPQKKQNLVLLYRIAAAIIFLAGVGSILYVSFRKPPENLITQETNHSVQQVPAATKPSEIYEYEATEQKKPSDTREPNQEFSVMMEHQTKSSEQESEEAIAPIAVAEDAVKVEESKMQAEPSRHNALEPAWEEKSASLTARGVSNIESSKTLSAKIIDSQGQPLPGVSILEKGTKRGTVTDMDGNFALQVSDTNPVLSISYIGFKPIELTGNETAAKEITLTEDLVALNEVVVIGYGTRQKSVLSGKAAGVEVKDDSKINEPESAVFINPIPPGGSLKEFKKWVNDRLDYSKFKAFPGKQRIQINLTVHTNGLISDIVIRESVPAPIAAEFKKVIAQSPAWKPALRNESPVETEVMIRFNIVVESP